MSPRDIQAAIEERQDNLGTSLFFIGI